MAHGKIYADVTQTMGETPLIQLNRLAAGLPGRLVVKHEGYNPFNSVKDRIGAAMVDDAIERGALRPGMVVVEPTSGNTGIGVAYAAVARGYRCIFVMPETMTVERRNMLRALGCKLVLTEGPKGMKGAIARAEEIAAKLGDRAWMPRQFDNPANPDIHYPTTGPEIWEDTGGRWTSSWPAWARAGPSPARAASSGSTSRTSASSAWSRPRARCCGAGRRRRTSSRGSGRASSPATSIRGSTTRSSP